MLWVVANVVGAVDNIENFIEGLFALDRSASSPRHLRGISLAA